MGNKKLKVKLGWKPDPKDHRDKVLRFKSVNLNALPKKVDLTEHCSTIENQTTLGSCTANAAVGALEYLEIKAGHVDENFENFSRLFVYYNMREIQGTLNEDSGGTIRDTIKALAAYGACDELLCPYNIEKFKEKPSPECYADGNNHKITEYSRLESFPDVLACLAAGYPVIFGFMTYDNFTSEEVSKTGKLELPGPNNIFQGGHAVTAVGYDMETHTVLVRNSWGEEWGMNGYFTMPFSYISNPNMAADFWTIKK